jgi:hypothetical protein
MTIEQQIKSAAQAVRERWQTKLALLDAYSAARLVQEQVNGPRDPWTGSVPDRPCSVTGAVDALRFAIPELFCDYQQPAATVVPDSFGAWLETVTFPAIPAPHCAECEKHPEVWCDFCRKTRRQNL